MQRWKKVEAADALPGLICHSCTNFFLLLHAFRKKGLGFFVPFFGPFVHFCMILIIFCSYFVYSFFRLKVLPVLFCKLFPSLL